MALSKQLLTYFNRTSFSKTIVADLPDVEVYLPSVVPHDKQGSLNIDFVGKKPAVDSAVKKLSELIGKLIGATRDMHIEWLLHRVIQGKASKK